MDDQAKKTVFSGVQPTGRITLGNYLGAIKNWRPLQEQYDCIFCVVDLHSLTVAQVPAELRKNTMELLALYIACGIDPAKSTLFIQSHVHEHAELTWILDTISYVGEMNRMTQFKEKSRKHADNINMGLMNYPVLMASDILLYQADLVPVGKDQVQHLELARNLAERFNNRYSETFIVPQGILSKTGSSIKSLQDPSAKMSKSDPNENAYVALTDDADTIRRKLRRAVTDCDTEVRFGEDKPAISNLLTIYSLCSGESIADAENRFSGKGYGVFKDAVADAIVATVTPIQSEQKRLLADKAYLEGVLRQGAANASRIAAKTLAKVYRKVGLVSLPRG
ncbi:MAG: tryptophan--tRNA ligase [Corallococcus sp.]|nr:tryptophan--tRNA ligase [Corallococcus sp.]MCM1359928.1 tryptophan--tRNA ligase [Corallococcus sp.]MCM1395484.1 tryptophan--tRNA ligase [Corallococcus sp.]